MFTSKSKKRAFSPTGNTIITIAVFTVLAKDIFFKIEILDTFLNDRKKFKIYEAQYRLYM